MFPWCLIFTTWSVAGNNRDIRSRQFVQSAGLRHQHNSLFRPSNISITPLLAVFSISSYQHCPHDVFKAGCVRGSDFAVVLSHHPNFDTPAAWCTFQGPVHRDESFCRSEWSEINAVYPHCNDTSCHSVMEPEFWSG